MAADVDICNRALQKLGAKRITSLTQDSVNARACNAAYTFVRDAELRDHPWNFAIKRVQLPESLPVPTWGKAHRFPLPSDFIRLLDPDPEDLNQQNSYNPTLETFAFGHDWIIEGRAIMTNDMAPINVRYIAQITDPNAWDPLFREALSSRLAIELCEEITQSNTKKAALTQEYKDIIGEAKRINGIEVVAELPPEDDWIVARR